MRAPEDKDNHGQRITRLEGAVESISSQVESLIKHLETRDQKLTERDQVFFKKLDEARELTRPNMAIWAAWAAVVVVIIFGIYTPFAAGLNDKVAATAKQSELADKMQQIQLQETEAKVDKLQLWRDDRLKADLEELRARRFKQP